MRSFLAGVAGLLAVVLLPVALIVAWVSGVATDTDAFVREMRPVVTQPTVQAALTDRVVTAVQGELGLPARTAKQIDQPLRQLVAEAVARPEVEQLWARGIRGAHREFVAVMEGRDAARVDRNGRVVMPLSVPLPGAADTLRAFGITDGAALEPSVPVPLFSADDLTPAQRAYALGSAAGSAAPWVVAGLALVAVALARRRVRALALLGVGGVIGAVVLAAIVVIGRTPVDGAVADKTGAAIVSAAYGMVEDGLMGQARLALVVSGGLVAVAAVAGLVRVVTARRG